MRTLAKHKVFIIISFLHFVTGSLLAQKFTANASKTKVAAGEQFQIAYTLNTGGSGFKTPDLNAFDVYSGPNPSSSMQFINGNMSQSVSFSFILAGRKEGKYTIPPASIVVNGNRIESNELIIEVTKGNHSQNQNPGTNSNNTTQQNASDNLFAKISVSKAKAYLGEQIIVSHKIYTRLNIRGFQDIQFPSYNGFWSQDFPQKSQIELTTENIDGIGYQVAEIKRSFIFAQRAGTLEISPTEIECVVRERTSNRPQSIFDQFFGNGGYRDVVYKIKSKPVKIEIIPLPEQNKPKDFNGAVGNYSYKAQVNKEKVKANDAINLAINISGEGNLKLLEAPAISFPEEFESYDPKVNENISVGKNGISGNKNFDFLLIPRHQGEYKISNFNFSYFDPNKKTYITLPSPEFTILVEESDTPTDPTVISPAEKLKEDVKVLGNDIRYIKTGNIKLQKKDKYFFGTFLFYSGLASPFLLLTSFLLLRRRYIEQQRDTIAVKSRKASKIAQKKLALAKTYMDNNSKEAFYDETLKAINGYFIDKFNLPASELSKESITKTLMSKNAPQELIAELAGTIEICEAARYAPSLAENDLSVVFNKAASVITRTENEIN